MSRVSVIGWISRLSASVACVHALAAREMHDGAPLRLGEAERLQPAVHAAAQQARDVADEKTQRAIGEERGGHECASVEY